MRTYISLSLEIEPRRSALIHTSLISLQPLSTYIHLSSTYISHLSTASLYIHTSLIFVSISVYEHIISSRIC